MNKIILPKLKKCLSLFLPDQYFQDKKTLTTIYKYLFIGLAIRVILIPFTSSPDLLWINWRAHLIVYHKNFFLNAPLMLNHYIHAFFMWIFSPLMPYHDQIWTHPWTITHPRTPEEFRAMLQTFYDFITHRHIFRTLTLLKLPYLLFDLVCISFILRLFSNTKNGLKALKFWLFNPINIIVLYVYGRFEVIPAVFILISLYLIKEQKPLWASFSLGLGIATRWYPAMFLPFYIVILGRTKKEKLYLLILGLLPTGLMNFIAKLGGSLGELDLAAKISHTDYLLSMNFNLGLHDTVYIFVLVYALLFLYSVYKLPSFRKDSNASEFEYIVRFTLAAVLLLFATCYFHLQFFMWPMTMLTLCVPYDKRLVKLFIISCLCWWVYTWQWGALNTTYLFSPLFKPDSLESMLNWPYPAQIIENFYPAHKFIGLCRSLLSAVLLAMTFLALKPIISNSASNNQENRPR
ncbi:MAG: hypothetical protein KAX15_01785 [Candidatus Omnitrophica bacterium]|nr:hypothetical protein [Candidatus Omnitrophota bacterium]